MSIFGSILAKIFPSSHPAVAAAAQGSTSPPSAASSAPVVPASPAAAVASGAAAPPTAQPAAAAPPVDVEAVVSAMPGAAQLNWKTSIVDLLKVLGLDSSLDARKALAQELGYTGSTADSAAMNMWLHKEVVAKLAANGGKVPDSMKT